MPPRDLSFSEITSRSFRTTWVSDLDNVLSFMVRFRPAVDVTGDYISMMVPGNTMTTILPNLIPLTTYEVNVIAQYEKGDSFPLIGEETTLEGKKNPDLIELHTTPLHTARSQGVYLCWFSFESGWFWHGTLGKTH